MCALSGWPIPLENIWRIEFFPILTRARTCIYKIQMNDKKVCCQKFIELLDSDFLKALSDPTRQQILKFLMINKRADIETVAENVVKDRSVISRHLHFMTKAKILRSIKISRSTYFQIDEGALVNKVDDIAKSLKKALKTCC